MNNRHQSLQGSLIKVLPAILLSLQMPLSARAAQAVGLKSEIPQIDARTVSRADTKPVVATAANPTVSQDAVPAEIKPLQGQVSEDDAQAAADKDQAPQLQPQTPESDPNSPYSLAVRKLQSGMKLSADEYRSLGIGTLGYESHRTFFQDKATIEQVYKGSPAEEAGLRVGDVMIDTRHDDSNVQNPTVPQWGITLARAGTTADVVLLKHGHLTTITLTRMNIEDLPDAKMRKTWEKIIDNLGHPPDGEYRIPNPGN